MYTNKRTLETFKAAVCIFVIITKAGALQFAQTKTADWLHFTVFRATPTDIKMMVWKNVCICSVVTDVQWKNQNIYFTFA